MQVHRSEILVICLHNLHPLVEKIPKCQVLYDSQIRDVGVEEEPQIVPGMRITPTTKMGISGLTAIAPYTAVLVSPTREKEKHKKHQLWHLKPRDPESKCLSMGQLLLHTARELFTLDYFIQNYGASDDEKLSCWNDLLEICHDIDGLFRQRRVLLLEKRKMNTRLSRTVDSTMCDYSRGPKITRDAYFG